MTDHYQCQATLHEAVVNLSKNTVVYNKTHQDSLHGPADYEEILCVERLVLEDAAVKAEIAKLNLPDDSLVMCEPWVYGRRA